jgi:hypothetical protein
MIVPGAVPDTVNSDIPTCELDISMATGGSQVKNHMTNEALDNMVVPGVESDVSNSDKKEPSIFDKLPIELRLASWTLCAEPRLVSKLAKVRGSTIPTVFHLCSESRTHMLASYARFKFDTPPPSSVAITAKPYDVLFNYDIDDLFLDIPHDCQPPTPL